MLERIGRNIANYGSIVIATFALVVGILAVGLVLIAIKLDATDRKASANDGRITIIERAVPCRDTGPERCLAQALRLFRECRDDASCKALLVADRKKKKEASKADPKGVSDSEASTPASPVPGGRSATPRAGADPSGPSSGGSGGGDSGGGDKRDGSPGPSPPAPPRPAEKETVGGLGVDVPIVEECEVVGLLC